MKTIIAVLFVMLAGTSKSQQCVRLINMNADSISYIIGKLETFGGGKYITIPPTYDHIKLYRDTVNKMRLTVKTTYRNGIYWTDSFELKMYNDDMPTDKLKEFYEGFAKPLARSCPVKFESPIVTINNSFRVSYDTNGQFETIWILNP